MKKKLLLLSLFIAIITFAQTSKWGDLFSYNNVLKIREDNDRLIAATENGIFFYYPSTGEIKKLSKANGLHDVKIAAFDYDATKQTGIVGYQNGSMDVITPNGIYFIVDIPLATGYNGSKKINHISINGDRAVISAGYGVSIFNISRREFGDTAFFASGGVYEAVNSAVIKDNFVYVATNLGLKRHELNSTFAIYSEWNVNPNFIQSGIFRKVDANNIIAFSSGNQVRYGDGTTFSNIPRTFGDIRDLRVTENQIIVTDQNQVYVYSVNGEQQKNFNASEELNTAIMYNNTLYTGTKLDGIYNEQKVSLKPDGPYKNTSYKLSLLNNQIWVSSGVRDDYDIAPNPSHLGYYHFDGSKWIYPNYFIQNSDITFNIMDVVPNPSNPSEVFFTNYTQTNSKGIYKMTDDVLAKTYLTELNSLPAGPYINRPFGCAFDDTNNLLCSVSHTTKGGGFYYYNRQSDNFALTDVAVTYNVQKPLAKDGMIYIPVPYTPGGMLVYNYNNTPATTSDDSFKFLNKNNNLPTDNRCASVALDKNDDLWIGTRGGLRVLSNPKSAILEDSPQTDEIIIEENGLAEELFRDALLLQITVDSGNQKWVSVDGGGVFYLSPSGDRTIYHFTKANSPLPNDSVTDIQVDEKTGKVYFATLDGIMVYQGDVTEVTSNFGDVLVYPNPVVYAQYKGNVRIRGLASKTNIRITDAAGNLVHSAVANGGYFEWNLNNQRGVRVASGIYYVLMTNEDGTDTATAKIAVVN
ncbi:T9SS type A sorting domain-containing protein [Epilithonimonas sp.]|uniref:type IX secretion system anionic LPS delivery protein PorZ n=1 Tax=Epilithonimonas sp. TaxID=2894511 RepID=UPI002898351A|nr:T9SS type A sorting domain-containing protein [Epilithonimonas sp.]